MNLPVLTKEVAAREPLQEVCWNLGLMNMYNTKSFDKPWWRKYKMLKLYVLCVQMKFGAARNKQSEQLGFLMLLNLKEE